MRKKNIIKIIIASIILAISFVFGMNKINIYAEDSNEIFITNEELFYSFVENSKTNSYAGKTITFSNRLIVDGTFTGIGSESTPFEGTINVIKDDFYIKNTGTNYFFNNLSTKAKFTNKNFTVESASSLTDKLTIAEGCNLDLTKVKLETTSISNGSGVLANTISGSSEVTITFGSNFNGKQFQVTDSKCGYAGLVTGVLESGTSLNVVAPSNLQIQSSYQVSLGGIVGKVESGASLKVSGMEKFTSYYSGGTMIAPVVAYLCGSLKVTGSYSAIASCSNCDFGGGVVAKTETGSSLDLTGFTGLESGTQIDCKVSGGLVGENNIAISIGKVVILGTIKGEKTGGFIGVSKENSDITGASGASGTFSGSVEGNGESSIAGGFIGLATAGSNSVPITISDNAVITGSNIAGGLFGMHTNSGQELLNQNYVINAKIKGTGMLGGYIGYGEYSSNYSCDDSKLTIDVTSGGLGNSKESGAFYGCVQTSANFTFTLTKNTTLTGFGMFGTLKATSKLNSITITANSGIKFTTSSISSAYQGVIASVVGENTYVRINGLSTECNVNDSAQIVEAQDYSVVDVGALTYTNTNGSILVGKALVGTVVRLNGALNTGAYKHLVKEINNSLVYYDGGFSLIRGTASGWDIGNYGGVVNNTIKDAKGNAVITFDSADHTVSLLQLSITSGATTFTSVAQAMSYAISLSSEATFKCYSDAKTNSLKALKITLDTDIDFTNTGIESFTKSSSPQEFTGTIYGQNHTITLSIGKDVTGVKRKRIYTVRSFLGLFGKITGGSFYNLNIDGYIYAGEKEIFVGSFGGYANSTTMKDCVSTVTLTVDSINNNDNGAGGIVGRATGTLKITNVAYRPTNPIYITNNNFGGFTGKIAGGTLILDNSTLVGNSFVFSLTNDIDNNYWIGGVVGTANDSNITINYTKVNVTISCKTECGFLIGNITTSVNKTIDLSNNSIFDSSIVSSNSSGKMGAICSNVSFKDITTIKIDGTTITNSTISAVSISSDYSGGFLGYKWSNAEIFISGQHSLNVSSTSGVSGFLKENCSIVVIESDFKNTGKISGNTGALVAKVTTKGMIFIGCTYADIFGNTKACTTEGVSTVAFDVVYKSQDVSNNIISSSGGLVSFESGATAGSIGDIYTSSWKSFFENVASEKNVRYYFNTYSYFYTERTPYQKTLSSVSNASDLVYWHLQDYLFDSTNLETKIKTRFFSTSIEGFNVNQNSTINCIDYCLYPTEKSNLTMNFNNSTIIFGLTSIVSNTTVNSQLYGLQFGLMLNIKSTADNAAELVVKNAIFSGKFYSNSSYSGFIVCGEVAGYTSSTEKRLCRITIENIILHGVANDNSDNPLMMNKIGANATLTFTGISAYASPYGENSCYYTQNAACALLGNVGSDTAQNLNVTFSDIALDSCMFSTALFMKTLKYSTGSKATYNFSYDDDWVQNGSNYTHIKNVTYGKEINFADQDQYYNDDDHFVSPTNNTGDANDFSGYLYYCGNSNNDKYKFNLYVNRKTPVFTSGYGTYANPYIIDEPRQLSALADIVAGSLPDGLEFNFPTSTATPGTSSSAYGRYRNVSNTVTFVDGTSLSGITKDIVSDWFRGAYFVISPQNSVLDLTASRFSSFVGIGTLQNPFHGVITSGVSGNVTIKMPTTMLVDHSDAYDGTYGSGFINVSNGCAVNGLTIQYQNVVFSDEKNTVPSISTNVLGLTRSTEYFYFGGVIGWNVGGDSSITNTNVQYLGNKNKLTINNQTSVFGGLVGLVSYGGITFNENCDVNYEWGTMPSAKFFSSCRIIGKVDNGYAITLKSTGDSNYVNSCLGDDAYTSYKLNAIAMPNSSSLISYEGNILTLSSAEEVFIFSLLANSGYYASTCPYTEESRSRYGTYTSSNSSGSWVISNTETTASNGLLNQDGTSSTPFVMKYFSNPLSKSTTITISFAENSTLDTSKYGNGFRGLGGANERTGEVKVSSVLGNNATICMNFNLNQCVTAFDKVEGDYVSSYGLFGKLTTACSFENITITGTVKINHYLCADTSTIYRYAPKIDSSVGSLVGNSKNGSFINVKGGSSTTPLIVEGPRNVGGLIGYYLGNTKNNITNCTMTSFDGYSNQNLGGIIGCASLQNEVTISNSKVNSSRLLVTVENNAKDSAGAVYQLKYAVGGFIGCVEGNSNGSLIVNNKSAVIDSYVIFYTKVKTSSFALAGGILGCVSSIKQVEVNDVCVDSTSVISFEYEISGMSPLTPSSIDLKNVTSNDSFVRKVYNYISTTANKLYQNGCAGGLVGQQNTPIIVTSFSFTSNTSDAYVLSDNNSAGIVSECRASFTTMTVSKCLVQTTNYNIYIAGIARTAGIMAFANSPINNIYVSECKVEGNANKQIFLLAGLNNDARGYINYVSSGFIGTLGDTSTGLLFIQKSSLKYCVVLGYNTGGFVARQQLKDGKQGSIAINDSVVDNCYFFSKRYSGIVAALETKQATINNVALSNNVVTGTPHSSGSLFVGTVQGDTIGDGIMTHNNAVGQVSINSITVNGKTYDAIDTSSSLETGNIKLTNTNVYKQIVNRIIDIGYSNFKKSCTFEVGNYAYFVKTCASGKLRLYNVVRSETSTTPASPKNLKTAGDGINAVAVFVGFGIYDGTSESFGAYADWVTNGANPEYISTYIDGYAAIGDVKGDPFALTSDETYKYVVDYLSHYEITDYKLQSTNKIQTVEFGTIPTLSFSDTTYKNTGILNIQTDNDKVNQDLVDYLNVLTMGGFQAQKNNENSNLTIVSRRYSFNDGIITDLGVNGSIYYENGSFIFNEIGGYDMLSIDGTTFTLLTITYTYSYKDLTGENQNISYTMYLMLYDEPILQMDSHVIPISGENYLISSFVTGTHNNVRIEGDSFVSLYIEYEYADIAHSFATNFEKTIKSVTNRGAEGGTPIPEGTILRLVDISSATPAGYKYYYYTLSSNTTEISLNRFIIDSGSNYIFLNGLSQIEQNISSDDSLTYIERYILVIEFPADIDEELDFYFIASQNSHVRIETVSITDENLNQHTKNISILPSPYAELSTVAIDDSADLESTFTNAESDMLELNVSGNVIFPYSYYAQQYGNSTLYGTYRLSLINSNHSAVTLPSGTSLIIKMGDNSYRVDASLLGSVKYEVGDLLAIASSMSNVQGSNYYTTQNISFALDFSYCSSSNFAHAFTQGSTYTLVTEFYLSSTNDYTSGKRFKLNSLSYTANVNVDINVNMVPTDSKNLGINVSPTEFSDSTNSGNIEFNLTADFTSLGESIPDNATLTFTLYKKVFENGAWKYVECETNIGSVWYQSNKLTNDSISLTVNDVNGLIEATFTYKIDFSYKDGFVDTTNLDLTSYRLAVKVSYDEESENSQTREYDAFFVFVIVDISTN